MRGPACFRARIVKAHSGGRGDGICCGDTCPGTKMAYFAPLCVRTGESFHFASRVKSETLRESIFRHEHFLALRLGLKPEHKARLTASKTRLPWRPSSP